MKNRKTGGILIVAGIIIFCLILSVILLSGQSDKKEMTKIGFIISGSTQEQGWNGMHYKGIKSACEQLGTELLVKENILEYTGQCETAIRELANEGATMIILSSYGYSKEAKEIVKEYPHIAFYTNYHILKVQQDCQYL